jgi:hypothetical protein
MSSLRGRSIRRRRRPRSIEPGIQRLSRVHHAWHRPRVCTPLHAALFARITLAEPPTCGRSRTLGTASRGDAAIWPLMCIGCLHLCSPTRPPKGQAYQEPRQLYTEAWTCNMRSRPKLRTVRTIESMLDGPDRDPYAALQTEVSGDLFDVVGHGSRRQLQPFRDLKGVARTGQ